MMLEKLFAFTRMLSEFREIKRMAKYVTSDVRENDTEHSYQLAMVCWYILEQYPDYDYDLNKVLKYALVHDIIEVYAGDTIPFESISERYKSDVTIFTNNKHQREKDALQRLEIEFPEVKNIRSRVGDYENKSDKEAIFVYAIDKLIPDLSIIPDNGKIWKEIIHSVTIQDILKHKAKALVDPLATILHDEIVTIITQHPEWLTR